MITRARVYPSGVGGAEYVEVYLRAIHVRDGNLTLQFQQAHDRGHCDVFLDANLGLVSKMVKVISTQTPIYGIEE